MTDPSNVNPYAPPEAPLEGPAVAASPRPAIPRGSLESALEGRYDLSIGEVLRESWERVRGFKLKFFLAIAPLAALNIIGSFALQDLFGGQKKFAEGDFLTGYLLSTVQGMVLWPLMMPLSAGMFVMVLRQVAGKPVRVGHLFSQFGKVLPLVAASFISTVLMNVGFVLLFIPGIFVSVAMSLWIFLMVDMEMGPWEAIRTSITAVRHQWFTFAGLFLASSALLMLSAIPLGIGLFWTVPMMMLAMGVAYARVFGIHRVAEMD